MRFSKFWKSIRLRLISITTISILVVVAVWIFGVNRIVLNTLTERIDTELQLLTHRSNRLLRAWARDNTLVTNTMTEALSRDVLVLLDEEGTVMYTSSRIKDLDVIPGYEEMMQLEASSYPADVGYRLSRVLRTGEPDETLIRELEELIIAAQASESSRIRSTTPSGNAEIFTVTIDGEEWRCIPDNALGHRLLYGKSMQEIYRQSAAVFTKLVMLVGVLTVLVILVTWVVAEKSLQPIHRISDLAETIDADSLHKRLDLGKAPSEFWRLLAISNNMLERLEKSFLYSRQFTANVSHEMKTPLAIMQGKLEAEIENEEVGSENQRKYVSLLEEVVRLSTITDRLLMLSRGDSGQLKIHPAPLDITEMLQSTIEDFDDGHLQFSMVRESEEHIQVNGDSMLLQEVFHNLYDNAVKFNRSGGSVQTRIATDCGNVVIDIGNSGQAIPEEMHPRVFERFFRCTDSQERHIQGSGLGLSIVEELLRLHGGSIALTRSHEDWTEFRIQLPLA